MKFNRSVFLLIPAMMILSACGGNLQTRDLKQGEFDGHSGRIKLRTILADDKATPAEKAERMAKAAEQLLTVQGFAYASDVADQALALDPNNIRGQFVKSVVAPVLTQQGIIERVRPLLAKSPAAADSYEKWRANFEQTVPSSTVKDFLLDGKPDLLTESDLQAHFDRLADAIDGIRLFAKKNKDSELVIAAPDIFLPLLAKRLDDACTITNPDWGDYEIHCPSMMQVLEVDMNRADFEGIQQMAAGLELYARLANSYDITGSMSVIDSYVYQTPDGSLGVAPPPFQQFLGQVLSNPKFAKVRQTNGFKAIRELGYDAISGLRWIAEHQDSLCQLGAPDPRNRINMLFNEGLCANGTDVFANAHKIEVALSGEAVPLTLKLRHADYMTTVQPSAIIDAPPADLRTLLPMSFDSCGNLLGLADNSLAGVLPHQDFTTIMGLDNGACGTTDLASSSR